VVARGFRVVSFGNGAVTRMVVEEVVVVWRERDWQTSRGVKEDWKGG
jgi:hypothetical protein